MMLRRFAEVDRRLPAGDGRRVLDVGSAWGFHVMTLQRRGFVAVGIDLVPDQFAVGSRIASYNGFPFDVAGADAAALPFRDGVFDCVTLVETFEHIYHADRARALSECHRVLRRGGRLVLSTPNHASLVERFKRFAVRRAWVRNRLPSMCLPADGTRREQYHPYRYHHPLPDREVVALLERAGFCVVALSHFLFMLKNTPDSLYGVWRSGEALLERVPGLRRLAATLCVVADRR
jgi:SAM-dependent methyltransferase